MLMTAQEARADGEGWGLGAGGAGGADWAGYRDTVDVLAQLCHGSPPGEGKRCTAGTG
jgi:hypothetical protein